MRGSNPSARVLAVDLGATSGRVASVDLRAPTPRVEIVHRFTNGPVAHPDGSLRWDWGRLANEVDHGLRFALEQGPAASIGVDTWGVDYGLVDGEGRLIGLPYSYRDHRTDGWRDVAQVISPHRLYSITGIQMMGINTVFQLAAHDGQELERAQHALLLPDLLVHHLTGHVGAERSIASTTGLLDASTGTWSRELIEAVDLPPGLFPEVGSAGALVGEWGGVPVHLVGGHDTASAFVAATGGPGTVFVSTGTWVLVGMERETPDTSDRARRANFSNEAGALGGFRFLKNVVGFWLLEECRPAWGDPPIERLLDEAEAIEGPVPTFDATDERFLSPADMEAEIRAAAGLGRGAGRALVVRSAVESMAMAVAGVVDELQTFVEPAPTGLTLVGGGARSALLRRLLARHSGLPVTVGSTEATALGNAVAQGVALGEFASVADGRRWIGHSAAGDEAGADEVLGSDDGDQ